MSQFFYGQGKSGPYFEGWYFKCQGADGRAIALIPAFHIDGENRSSASLQVITEDAAWWIDYPREEFSASEQRLSIRLGPNSFSDTGIRLKTERPDISLHGKLDFGPFCSLGSDIMGPFRFVGNMECSHGVISMRHALRGQLTLNGACYDFSGGTGYIETDRGRAFPRAYLWTQCFWSCGSLMLSVAAVPLGGIRFTGCICALVHNGREYRLATYRGVRVERWSERGVLIRQGKYRLEIEVLEAHAQPLRAPENGAMERIIRESLHTKMRCRFWVGDTLLLDRADCDGSFEYAKPEPGQGDGGV